MSIRRDHLTHDNTTCTAYRVWLVDVLSLQVRGRVSICSLQAIGAERAGLNLYRRLQVRISPARIDVHDPVKRPRPSMGRDGNRGGGRAGGSEERCGSASRPGAVE
jgi:hypothetical protein